MIETKVCTKCSLEQPVSEYHKHKGGKLKPQCKTCRKREWSEREKDECACGSLKGRYATTCRTCANRLKGEKHHSWRGGKYRTSQGYIEVMHEGRKVLEHRIVMEEVLGRSLLPGENVHHKNGVKDDNRPENLELWVTYQPQGQRPEDLLEWADEIYRRYKLG